MGQKTVMFSDLSGAIISQEDTLARIVIREHPELGDSPVEIDVLSDEARMFSMSTSMHTTNARWRWSTSISPARTSRTGWRWMLSRSTSWPPTR